MVVRPCDVRGHSGAGLEPWIGIVADWARRGPSPWPYLVGVTPKQLATHAHIVGATGSGKTVLLLHLLYQDLRRGTSVCLFDARGDLVDAAVELCVRAGVLACKVRVIDLREKKRPFGFNPLFGAGEPFYRALSVIDVVEKESESWGVQLSETLRNALLLLAELREPVTRLESLFYDRRVRQAFLERAKDGSAAEFWKRYDALSAEKQASLAMPVMNKVSRLMATENVRRVLGHPEPIDLGKHLDTPGSVLLVSLAVDELHGTGRMMGSLVLSAVCREIFARVSVPEARRNTVRCFVDEFQNFGLQDFEGVLAEGRRFKFSLVLAHQHTAQLTPRMRSMVLGNVGVKFVFRCGREDAATMNRDLFGKPSHYPLTDLPTGHALLWRKGDGVLELEVSEPLLKNIGSRSDRARAYLDEVYKSAGVAIEQPVAREEELRPEKARRLEYGDGLEDWLCD